MRRHDGLDTRLGGAEADTPLTLGQLVEAVASETEDAAELVRVVASLLRTRRVRWARAGASEPCGSQD